MASNRLFHASPVLASLNFDNTEAFYHRLGFTTDARYGDDYLILARDTVAIHFWPCKNRHIAENTSCYIYIENAKELHGEWKQVEGMKLTAPKPESWGMLEFHVHDPDGNLLRFGEAIT